MTAVANRSSSETPATEGVDRLDEQQQKLEFHWQPLSLVDHHINRQRGWPQTELPAILNELPENLTISQQLQNILQWSIQRIERKVESETINSSNDREGKTVETAIHENDNLSGSTGDKFTPPESDESDTATTSSGSKVRMMSPLLSRLSQIRQDVATKIALRTSMSSARKSTATQAVEEPEKNGECISCFDEFPARALVQLSCSHDYCKPCLREVILNAMKTESAFPPKCCLTEIPLKTVLSCLDNKQRDEYKEKSAEYSIPAGHRWYCPEPACGKWIRPEKLHRDRKSRQICPFCKCKICSICRSLAHEQDEECPQDFGLESTLEVAESEGWRRCYSCRTMVELTTGCRHITCKCGAQFCYVCSAKWGTCHCTEADKERRLQQLRTQREERDQRSQEEDQRRQEEDEAAIAEAEEVADAIRQVEEMERQDAIQRAEEEHQRQLEEELALARLEEARLLEEIARREAEEDAEKQYKLILVESSKDECQTMWKTLTQILNFQHAAMISHHASHEHAWFRAKELQETTLIEENDRQSQWLHENIRKRSDKLEAQQREERNQLDRKHEEEEDDLFMQVTMYLRDKPNREQREKKMRDALQKQHTENQDALQEKHDKLRLKLKSGIHSDLEGFQKAQSVRLDPVKEHFQSSLEQLGTRIGCDRHWFHLVTTRRIQMLKEHKRLVLAQLEAEEEPIGLTSGGAKNIEPLLPSAESATASFSEITDDTSPTSLQHAHHAAQATATRWHGSPSIQETEDLYGAPPENTHIGPGPELQPSNQEFEEATHQSQLSRSDTIVRRIPGAYPIPQPSVNRHTHPPTAQPPTLKLAVPNSTGQKHNSMNGAVSMSGVVAMSFVVPDKDASIPFAPAGHGSPNNNSKRGALHVDYHNTATTRTDSPASLSGASPMSADADADMLDSISASVVASRGPMDRGGRRRLFGGGFRKNRDMSEEELRRRMSATVGDGVGS